MKKGKNGTRIYINFLEGDRDNVKSLSMYFVGAVKKESERKKRCGLIIVNLIGKNTDHMHSKFNTYAAWFYTCEQLNFLVVILAWLITDKFLKHQVIISPFR